MREIEITYTAFSKVFVRRCPFNTPIGAVHARLAGTCSTYHIAQIRNTGRKNRFQWATKTKKR